MERGENEDNDVWAMLEHNDDTLLRVSAAATGIVRSLIELAQTIYSQPLPSALYPPFRHAAQHAHNLFNALEEYQMQSNEFQVQREEINEELREGLEELARGQWGEYPGSENGRQRELEEEVVTLRRILDSNNRDFQEQIGVYNQHLFGLKQALGQAEERLVRAQEQEVMVDELENRLVVLREERERDLMLIDSMARKIRFFERQRGGRQAFLSPPILKSPDSARITRNNLLPFKRN